MSEIMKKDGIYIITSEDALEAGHVNFIDVDGERIIFHTETTPEYGGRGYASTLIRTLLEDTAADGLEVVAMCPFVARWLEKNPDEISLKWRAATEEDHLQVRQAGKH